ncbi:MAG TPA: hypothetical protein VK427_10565, partial [Kofleriaceae bacterium]|nr:hypothetical protein [Kofleriaceae bacterium]
MIRRHVLAALSSGVRADDDEVARGALAHIDWVLRGLARRRLESMLLDATLAAGPTASTRHRLRAAALLAAGVEDCRLGDAAAVADAYAKIVVGAPPRLPIATGIAIVLAAGITLLATFAAVRVVTAGVSHDSAAPPSGAYRSGGAPHVDAEIENVLVAELPALDAMRVTDPARTAKLAMLRDHPAFAAHGDALAAAWRAMLDAHARWRDAGAGEAGHRARELHARVRVLSEQLAAQGLAYYVDVELGEDSRRTPGLYAFRVEDVAFVLRGEDRVRVLGVRATSRADQGAVTVLGMTASEPRDPIVLLDEVDAKVRAQILPVLDGD